MKTLVRYLFVATMLAAAPASRAVIILSQNFDTSPVNYTLPGISDPFRIDTVDAGRYWALSNMPGIALDSVITGNTTTYLTGKNMNNDGDGFTLTFDQFTPGQIDFLFPAFGNTDLKLSVDLAGAPAAEPENFLRVVLDLDGDTFYETTIFNFTGSGNNAYTDTVMGLGSLSTAFATFSNIPLPPTTAPDGRMRLRFEIFNDTNSVGALSETEGVDNIVVTGLIPEPTTTLLLLTGLVACAHRRRR